MNVFSIAIFHFIFSPQKYSGHSGLMESGKDVTRRKAKGFFQVLYAISPLKSIKISGDQ